MGFTHSARRFTAINTRLASVGAGNTLEFRINVRNKLTNQQFGDAGCLVLSGAGGKHICAACLPLTEADELVIDQTLYWQVVPDEDEAWFRTGVLNSSALTEAILPFNPEGDFGPRHIHTLPYRLMPAFDSANDDHQRIAELARRLATFATATVAGDAYIGDPSRSLPVRRRKKCAKRWQKRTTRKNSNNSVPRCSARARLKASRRWAGRMAHEPNPNDPQTED
ncbi:hypothetical protein ACFOHS_22085 [Jhaorihella thermophila]